MESLISCSLINFELLSGSNGGNTVSLIITSTIGDKLWPVKLEGFKNLNQFQNNTKESVFRQFYASFVLSAILIAIYYHADHILRPL